MKTYFPISRFDSFTELGINGKKSRGSCGNGLVNPKYVDQNIGRRIQAASLYAQP